MRRTRRLSSISSTSTPISQQLGGDAVHVLGDDVADLDLPAAGGHSRHIGARLDLVGNDGVGAAVELLHAADLDDVGAGALDIGAHGVEEVGHVHDVGLLGHVFHHRQPLGQDGGQHDVDGGAHRDLVQEDVGARQPAALTASGVDKAALDLHLGPQGLEPLQVLVDGTGAAKVAAAGQRHIRQAEPAQQGPDQVVGGPAAAGGVIGNPGVAHWVQSISTVLGLTSAPWPPDPAGSTAAASRR